MEKQIIIGIAGHYGSGKDAFGEEVVRLLNEQQPGQAKIFKFAGPLKRMAKKYFGWDGNKNQNTRVPTGPQTEVEYIGGRKLLQGIGMLLREETDPLFWLKATEKAVKEDDCRYAVITDTRFINEAGWVRDEGGHLIRIVRKGFDGDDDPSEAQMREPVFQRLCSLTFENDGTLDDLKLKAKLFVDSL